MTPTSTVYLALGSNQGDRLAKLQQAIQALPPAFLVEQLSPVYETPPWGFTEQPAFLNMALRGTTGLAPLDLLERLKAIEVRLGRQPTFRYGPRPIDLDILFYDDLLLETPRLVIPHPGIASRGFVLRPLADLAPNLAHPLLGKTIQELLEQVDSSQIRLFQTTILY